jgi:hypothetical protein
MNVENVSAEKFGIEEVKAKQIRQQFEPMLKLMDALEEQANKVFEMKKGTKESEEKAREVRLKLVKARTGTASIHKDQKEFYIKAGKYIDGWKNAQLFAGQGLEEKLLGVENYSAIKLAEKVEKLNKKRLGQIKPYIDLEHNDLNFGSMQEDVWESYLEKKIQQSLELIQAEKDAEIKQKEEAKKILVGQERFAELMELSPYLKKRYGITELTEISADEYLGLIEGAIATKKINDIGKERFVQVAKYVNLLSDPITSYDFREMTNSNFDNFLFKLIDAERDQKERERKKALALPYLRFIDNIEKVLLLDVVGFAKVMASCVNKDKEEKDVKAKRERRGLKLSSILFFVDDYEKLINSTDIEFQKGLTDAQERADKRTQELRLQATKEGEERAERVRLQGIENDRKEKAVKDAKDAEKLAKAPVKKQFQSWIDSMNITNAPVENELSAEILKKFEGFKQWAKKEVEKL